MNVYVVYLPTGEKVLINADEVSMHHDVVDFRAIGKERGENGVDLWQLVASYVRANITGWKREEETEKKDGNA